MILDKYATIPNISIVELKLLFKEGSFHYSLKSWLLLFKYQCRPWHMQIFHPVTVKVKCRRDNFVPLVFAPISCVLLHFWHYAPVFVALRRFCHFALARSLDPRGRRRPQACITGRWSGKLPWNCPLSLSPLPPNCPFSASRFDWKQKCGLVSAVRKYSELSCIVARGGFQLWVKSTMKCPYFMLQALFDAGD